MKNNTCCFFGHRTINETNELRTKLMDCIEKLITDEKVDTFLFGSKSEFDRLCLELVTELKGKYPHIKRIYVRAEYPVINDVYSAYLLDRYDFTYYPQGLIGAGRAVYVERNREMIDRSGICVAYCAESDKYGNRKSGSRLALDYAEKRGKRIIRFS